MLKVTMLTHYMTVELTGDNFLADLERLKDDIQPEHRAYDPVCKCWRIYKPFEYRHVPWVKAALDDHERQLSLF